MSNLPPSTFEAFLRDRVRAMPRAERIRLFMAGVGADEEPNLDVLREIVSWPEPDAPE